MTIKIPNPYKHWLRGNYSSRRDIQEIIRQASVTCDIQEVYPLIEWHFSNRLTETLGLASWWVDDDGKNWQIKFASQLWMGMTDTDRKNTIVHEVCHLAVEKIFGHKSPYVDDHGTQWRALMVKCGEDPDRISCGNW